MLRQETEGVAMTLRVLSYNILEGGEDRLAHIANVIASQQPDVVALLEANERTNAETLARQLGMHLTFGEANSPYHVAWLSRHPVIREENYRLAVLAKTLLKIEVQWEGSPLALFATHLQHGRSPEQEQYRGMEMQAILEILRAHSEQPHMLMGDFNSLAPTDIPDIANHLITSPNKSEELMQEGQFVRDVIPVLLQAGYVDSYRTLHLSTPGYTYKLPRPSLRLDYIFIPPTLTSRLQACDVVTGQEAEIASDHLPILAEFS